MVENPPDPAPLSAPAKRYVPPNQRNRRKSGADHRSEPPSTNPVAARSVSDAEPSRSTSQSLPLLISLNGCCRSEAFRLLRHRWDAAIKACHDPSIASFDRPVMYTGRPPSAWGSVELPHQLMSGPPDQVDIMAQLRRAMDEKRDEERE